MCRWPAQEVLYVGGAERGTLWGYVQQENACVLDVEAGTWRQSSPGELELPVTLDIAVALAMPPASEQAPVRA